MPDNATFDDTIPNPQALRALLRESADGTPRARVDVGAVIARSRRRRLPRQLAASSVGVLAIAGIGVAGVNILRDVAPVSVLSGAPSTSSAEDSGAEGTTGGTLGPAESGVAGGGISLAPAEKTNLCGTLGEVPPARTGLVATPQFPGSVPVGTETIPGTVTVTNTGPERVTGYTGASPAMTLSQDGITLWHSNGPQIALAQPIDLKPGASMELPASVTPVRCEIEDDAAESFRDDLPALPPGSYELSAIFYLTLDSPDDSAAPDIVSGPQTTITLQ